MCIYLYLSLWSKVSLDPSPVSVHLFCSQQTATILQALAYAVFFPKRTFLLLLPQPAAASSAATAGAVPATAAAGWGRDLSSPAPVYVECFLPVEAEAADAPEALGLAATMTAAINRITAQLQRPTSSSNEQLLSLEGVFRLTEALMLRDISFTAQLLPLAQQHQQQQQVQQLWEGYRQELNELLLLLLQQLHHQQHQWDVCTTQELLLFLLSCLRVLGIGNPQRTALAAALTPNTEQQQRHHQPAWQHDEDEQLPEFVSSVLSEWHSLLPLLLMLLLLLHFSCICVRLLRNCAAACL